jgi:hypothetical protein
LRAGLIALATLALAATSPKAQPQVQRMSFAIMRNAIQIGQHDIAISTEGATTTVDFRTEIQVKVMFINAYSFGYAGREIWTQNNFVSFQSKTNDNGASHAVSATFDTDKTVIAADGKTISATGNVIPASFWNMAFLTRTDFFHTENGQLLKISVTDLGDEQISTRMGPKLAHHYRLTGGLERDLWFDQNGTPLRYQLRGSDNSLITSEALP